MAIVLKYNDFLNESTNGLEFKILDKELMNVLIDDIYEISSRESDTNDHWKRWSKEDFLCDLPGKWKYSLVAMLGDKVVAFQINSLKTKDGFSFVHTNRLLKDRRYKDIHLFKEIYEKLFSLIRANGLTYWTCFTPFKKIKNMCVDILGAKASTNISDFIDKNVVRIGYGNKLHFDDGNSLYFLTKKLF